MSKRDTVTHPHIDPRLTDPRAAAYKKGLEARKVNTPVGSGFLPPIPALDRNPPVGGPPMPMSAYAVQQRQGSQVQEGPDGGIFVKEPAAASPFGVPGILQTDLLPEAAKQDPAYREGAGSGYAVNQPNLAAKYGVIRGNNHIPPQALNPQKDGARKLSDKTVKGLEEVLKFQQQRQEHEGKSAGDAKAEQDALKGSAAAAARLANMPGDNSSEALPQEARKELTESTLRKMDDFDFDTFRQMMMKDLLNNPEQREIIEERLQPMDVGDLIMAGSVAQEVVIVPGKLWVVFRSVSVEVDLAVKRLIMQEAKSIQIDDRYYLDKFAFMSLTLGLESICGNPLPSHKVNGRFDEKSFWTKFDYVVNLNIHLSASLGVNYFWFDVRTRKLVVAERIKNG